MVPSANNYDNLIMLGDWNFTTDALDLYVLRLQQKELKDWLTLFLKYLLPCAEGVQGNGLITCSVFGV